MRKLKKILFAVSTLVILSATTVTAKESIINSSQEETENVQKGSVQIVLTDAGENTKKEGIGFQCIKVANAEDGEYLLLDQFQGTGIKLNKITTSYEMDQIAKKLAGQNYVEEMKTTDQNGKVAFQNLETGVYLIKAMKSETYDTISPVLVAIPTWNEADKIMEYDVTVFPKHSAEGTKTVKTGDSVEWRKYLILLLISGLGIGYFGVKRKNL